MENFHVLSLSGGGYKGLYTAQVLAELEKKVDCPVAHKFDLLAGTSVGGITALALAHEVPAEKIVMFFKQHGEDIFPKFPKTLRLGFYRAKYANTGLKKALDDIFGNATIGDLKHRVIIPAINYVKGGPQLIKTRHHKNFVSDPEKKLVDVAMATSAAPIFFPIYRTVDGDFVDGGLIANHPGFFALMEARQFLGIDFEKVTMLHVGTLSGKYTGNGKKDLGLFRWNVKLLNLLFSCQEQSVHQILKFLLQGRYYSIDTDITDQQAKKIGLDKISHEAKMILIQQAKEMTKQYFGSEHW